MPAFDDVVLADNPVFYMPDASGQDVIAGRHATLFHSPGQTTTPNGDEALVFNGEDQYAEIPDDDIFSIETTGYLTIECWVRPDILQHPNSHKGYVYPIGKGIVDNHEWALRMYDLENDSNRPNRFSAYVWNLDGGWGYGAYVQEPISVGDWSHYVIAIDGVNKSLRFYKNGEFRDDGDLSPLTIGNGHGPVRIGTRSRWSWFKGAVGKVAVYNTLLSDADILRHYQAMHDLLDT